MRRASRVRRNHSHTAVRTANAQTALGRPAVLSPIQAANPAGTVPPAVGRTTSAMPSKMDHVASVTMNGCRPSQPMSRPLTMPPPAPTARITTLQASPDPVPRNWVAASAVPSERIPPTDRSIPAVKMTMPWPRASVARARPSAASVPIWLVLRVPGCRAA